MLVNQKHVLQGLHRKYKKKTFIVDHFNTGAVKSYTCFDSALCSWSKLKIYKAIRFWLVEILYIIIYLENQNQVLIEWITKRRVSAWEKFFYYWSWKRHKTTKTEVKHTKTKKKNSTQPQTMWLTLLAVVKLVELAGFRLALAEDQVVSDVAVGVIWRFPLENDLGRRVGRGNGVQRDGGFCTDMKNIEEVV